MLVDERDTEKLREIIYNRFREEWEVVPNNPYNHSMVGHLCWLLGHKGVSEMLRNYTDEDARVVRLLAGPHGYTIYKALLARREAAA